MVKEYVTGLMDDDMKDNGQITKWMDSDYTHGQMDELLKDTM